MRLNITSKIAVSFLLFASLTVQANSPTAEEQQVDQLVQHFANPKFSQNKRIVQLIRKKNEIKLQGHLVGLQSGISMLSKENRQKIETANQKNTLNQQNPIDAELAQYGIIPVQLTSKQVLAVLNKLGQSCGISAKIIRDGKTLAVDTPNGLGYLSLEEKPSVATTSAYNEIDKTMFLLEAGGNGTILRTATDSTGKTRILLSLASEVTEPSLLEKAQSKLTGRIPLTRYTDTSSVVEDCSR